MLSRCRLEPSTADRPAGATAWPKRDSKNAETSAASQLSVRFPAWRPLMITGATR